MDELLCRKKMTEQSGNPAVPLDVHTYLPLIHFILFCLVLAQEIIQHFLQAVAVRLERRNNFFYGAFNEHSIDHAKAFSITWQRFQSL